MKIYTFVLTLVVILNSTESTLQSGGNPDTIRNYGSSSPERQQSRDQLSGVGPPLRGRARSPPGRPPSFEVLGYALGELGYIRLKPRTNQSLQFEFRRYIVPAGKPIRVREARNSYVPVPDREYIVLSASNGDIFAILEYSGLLRGIYRTGISHSRVKINMRNGAIKNMTPVEVRNCPVGEKHPIFPRTFIKVVTEYNSLPFELNHDSERDPVSSSSVRQQSPDQTSPEKSSLRSRSKSPQGRPPSSDVLGYPLKELGYIRLSPRSDQSLQFAFRRYIIPEQKPIRVRVRRNSYSPIPKREHIVLSASNSDVFAILEYSGVLRGIYRADSSHSRVKINMISGAVNNMNSDEIRDCQIGEHHQIFPHAFTKVVTKYNSLHPELDPNSERYPVSSSDRQQSPDRAFSLEPSLRGRSISPTGRPPSVEVLGYTLRELGYIRLSPRTNQSLQFEFRRYVFSAIEPIRLRAQRNNYVPVPNREQIVLAASNGDIFAILEYSGFLRGIYRTNKSHSRAKVNIISGAVDNMNLDEVRDCPIGENHPIFPQTFTKVFVDNNSLQFQLNPDSERHYGSSSSARQHSPGMTSPQELLLRDRSESPPGRPPSEKVLGYALGQLGYIRLIPETNRLQRFEFRRYVVPVEMRIQVKGIYNNYIPLLSREYIVLTTSNGDAFAILEDSGILRGLYKADRNHTRIKINVISGAIENMTADEKLECQVGRKNPIFPRRFTEVFANNDSLQTVYH